MINLDATWRQCMDCAGIMVIGFSVLMVVVCAMAAFFAAFGSAETEPLDKSAANEAHREDEMYPLMIVSF